MSSREAISCGNCTGACCRQNTTMPLNATEVEFHRTGGTELSEVLPAGDGVRWGSRLYFRFHFKPKDFFEPKRETAFVKKRVVGYLRPGEGLYHLDSDCGYLIETDGGPALCGVHESPQRPEICSRFKEGSQSCKSIRERYGVGMDTEEINLNLVGAAAGEVAVQAVQAIH